MTQVLSIFYDMAWWLHGSYRVHYDLVEVVDDVELALWLVVHLGLSILTLFETHTNKIGRHTVKKARVICMSTRQHSFNKHK